MLTNKFMRYNSVFVINFTIAIIQRCRTHILSLRQLLTHPCPSVTLPSQKDWNQINQQDSSVSGCDSTHEDEELQLPTNKLAKVISEPGTPNKQLTAKASLNDISELNLEKLQVLECQQVWLFVPKPYNCDNTEEIYSAIKQIQKLTKVLANPKGWNVLVDSKQTARKLIENGYKVKKIGLRFYVSTKNYEPTGQPSLSRTSSTSQRNDTNEYETPRKYRPKFEQENSKRKVRYLEKVTDTKVTNKQSTLTEEELQQPREKAIGCDVTNQVNEKISKHEQNQPTTRQKLGQTRPKYKEKASGQNSSTPISGQILPSTHLIQSLNKPNELQALNSVSKISSQQQHVEESDKRQLNNQPGQKGLQNDESYDSEESLERMRKAIRRKTKKMNKKKTNDGQTNIGDANNPFWQLGN